MAWNSHITQLKAPSFSITTVKNKWGETPAKQFIIGHQQAKILQSHLTTFPLIVAIRTSGSIPQSPRYSDICRERKQDALWRGTEPTKGLDKDPFAFAVWLKSSRHLSALQSSGLWSAVTYILAMSKGKEPVHGFRKTWMQSLFYHGRII